MEEIVNLLINKNETISTMESCTGGALSNAITNISGASNIFSFSAITYSNEYKIKMGVDQDIINKYSVYSIETAKNMAYTISNYTNSTYGVGVTGKLKRIDENNLYGEDDLVYLSIYNKKNKEYYCKEIRLIYDTREENKEQIIEEFINLMQNILK